MKRVSISTILNGTIFLLLFLAISIIDYGKNISVDIAPAVITTGSAALFIIEVLQLRKHNIGLFSIIFVFVVLCHVFFLGNFYLKAFGQEEFYVYNDWLSNDPQLKIEAGLFSLLTIHALFMGIIIALDKYSDNTRREYKFALGLNESDKSKVILRTGFLLLLIGMPFHLILDISRIRYSAIANMYTGFEGSVGLADDLYVFLVPAIICLLFGKRNNKRICNFVLWIYLIWTLIVMAASGARREYATGIIAVVLCYYSIFQNNRHKGHFVRNIIIVLLGIILLNFLTMIREYRHTQLGISYLLTEHIEDLFSLNFLGETIAEFSLTGSPIYFSIKYFPSTIPYQYGFTYIASTIYILPIGWLVSLNSSIGSMLYSLTGWAAGGSLAADLYANWGWVSTIFAVIIGFIVGRFCDTRSDNVDTLTLSSVAAFSLGYIFLTYPRASTSEVMRHGAYIILMMYFLFRSFSLNIIKRSRDYLN